MGFGGADRDHRRVGPNIVSVCEEFARGAIFAAIHNEQGLGLEQKLKRRREDNLRLYPWRNEGPFTQARTPLVDMRVQATVSTGFEEDNHVGHNRFG